MSYTRHTFGCETWRARRTSIYSRFSAPGIVAQRLRQEFQRHGLAENQVQSPVDLAHAAASDRRHDAIAVRENRAFRKPRRLWDQQRRSTLPRGRVEELSGGGLGEQGLDLGSQLPIGTDVREKPGAIIRCPVHRQVIQLFDLLPALPSHTAALIRDSIECTPHDGASTISPSYLHKRKPARRTIMGLKISSGVFVSAAQESQVSRLLRAWRDGDASALDRLTPLLYDEMRRLAHRHMRREQSGNTLQTTALANEAYLRLAGITGMSCQDRSHFLALAAEMMRRILVDAARARRAAKRGAPNAFATRSLSISTMRPTQARIQAPSSSPWMTRSMTWQRSTNVKRALSSCDSSAG